MVGRTEGEVVLSILLILALLRADVFQISPGIYASVSASAPVLSLSKTKKKNFTFASALSSTRYLFLPRVTSHVSGG